MTAAAVHKGRLILIDNKQIHQENISAERRSKPQGPMGREALKRAAPPIAPVAGE